MSPAQLAGEAWTVLQRGGSHGGGNQLFVTGEPGRSALLKLYRRRGPRWKETLKRLGAGLLEQRRGVTAAERCALERECLTLWKEHGFDVPALLDRPLPDGVERRTASWIEYCPGRLLSAVVADSHVSLEAKLRLVDRLAAVAGRRHALALARRDPRFVIENASIKHVIVSDERLVHIDLENAFHRRVDLLDALSREVSTTLRSLCRHAPGDFEALATRFVRAHPDPGLLRRAALHGALGRAPTLRLRRWRDRRGRAPGTAKADMLCWLLEALEGPST